MKTVCVFGADGRTGRCVVEALLAKGYGVVASVYNEKAAHLFADTVVTKVCNVLKQEDVTSAVLGADAVISVVGHVKGSDPRMQTRGMKNIVSAMKEKGVRRILSLTGTGVRIAGDTPSIADRILNVAIRRVDPERVRDGIEHADVLKKSNLDWTILRVLKLGGGTFEGTHYTLTEHGPAEIVTSREKVAYILTEQVEDTAFYAKMPVVS